MILPKFQFAGRHVLNIVSSVYLAAIVANAVGKFVPSLRLATFVVLSVSLILFDVALLMRELQHGHESLTLAGISVLPFVIVGIALAVLVGRIITHFGSDSSYRIHDWRCGRHLLALALFCCYRRHVPEGKVRRGSREQSPRPHLTNRSSQPLAVAMRTFDFMKQFNEFATLATASGGSAPSR